MKAHLLDDNMRASIALYQTQRDDLLLDYTLATIGKIDASGYGSRGVEVDLSGQITNDFKLISNYAFGIQRSHDMVGAEFAPQIARHRFFFWAEYTFHTPAWDGFGMGGGIVGRSAYAGGRDGPSDEPFKVPGQASVGISAFYRAANWKVVFGLQNIFNRPLYAQAATTRFVPVDLGRTLLLTGEFRF